MNLDEIWRITNAATPGPWEIDKDKFGSDFGDYTVYGIKGVADVDWAQDSSPAHMFLESMTEQDAEFIANARTWVPQLVSEVELLRQIVAAEDSHKDDDCPVCDHLVNEQVLEILDDNDELRDRINRALALHMPDEDMLCEECREPWPCATEQILDI